MLHVWVGVNLDFTLMLYLQMILAWLLWLLYHISPPESLKSVSKAIAELEDDIK